MVENGNLCHTGRRTFLFSFLFPHVRGGMVRNRQPQEGKGWLGMEAGVIGPEARV
jgi:hypothetical protein